VDGIDTPPRGQRDAQKMNGDAEQPRSTGRRATAEAMATKQRDISVSEFFTKNRHLLGFDNPAKALLTTIKEAVDNALDACEEAGILPDHRGHRRGGRRRPLPGAVEDNGPGIVKEQIPKIFAKLLYGSKFHRLRQSRGQQGIGISAAGMYGQLTTGARWWWSRRPARGARRGASRCASTRAPTTPRCSTTTRTTPCPGPRTTAPRWRSSSPGSTAAGPHLGRRVPRADRRRQPAPGAQLPLAQGRERRALAPR
jgi:hypothetical protein